MAVIESKLDPRDATFARNRDALAALVADLKVKVESIESEHEANFTRNHLRIEVAPGVITDDAYLLVPDGTGPFPAVIVVFYDDGLDSPEWEAASWHEYLEGAKRQHMDNEIALHVLDTDVDKARTQIRIATDERFPDGLILDVRGNAGGLITAGEFLLQVLTPALIEPEHAVERSTESLHGTQRQRSGSLSAVTRA